MYVFQCTALLYPFCSGFSDYLETIVGEKSLKMSRLIRSPLPTLHFPQDRTHGAYMRWYHRTPCARVKQNKFFKEFQKRDVADLN